MQTFMKKVIVGLGSLLMAADAFAAGIAGFSRGPRVTLPPPRVETLHPAAVIQPDMVEKLELWFASGIDDLRGATETLSIRVHRMDGSYEDFSNINAGTSFSSAYEQFIELKLTRSIPSDQIASLELTVNGKSSSILPKWDLLQLRLKTVGPNPLERTFPKRDFTATRRQHIFHVNKPKGMFSAFQVVVTTGADDMKSDIAFVADSSNKVFYDANMTAGELLQAWSTKTFVLPLKVPFPADDIKAITIGAFESIKNDSSWDMHNLAVYGLEDGREPVLIARANPKKLTPNGDNRFALQFRK